MSMIHMRHLAALALLASSAAQPAGAPDLFQRFGPDTGDCRSRKRYILMVLDQADRT